MNVDTANRAAMADPRAVAHYAEVDYLDPGEAALYRSLAGGLRGEPILDIGVGGGRTVAALTALSSDYVGIDYTPAMVEACARRFPALRFEHGDARQLRFADGHFSLVVFSCAGLDMFERDDRARMLSEARRVLKPGGTFIFSTHSLDAPELARRRRALLAGPQVTRHPIRLARSMLGALRRTALRLKNHLRLRSLERSAPGWAVLNSSYHEFSTLMHYTTAANVRAELAAAGFAPDVQLLTNEGAPITGDRATTLLIHALARVPVSPHSSRQ